MSPKTNPTIREHRTIHIYIDNSNLWIQGQKTYAKSQGLVNVSWDPTWRFDVGHLKSVLTGNSSLRANDANTDIKVNLYGSTPPPVDTVWKAIESHNVNVSTFARSTWDGREKQVDAQLALDSTEQAVDDYYLGNISEFIIVSGDRDLLSAVQKITKRGFAVQVWSWKDGLSNAFAQEQDKLVTVHLLDPFLEKIGFRETNFRVDRNTISPHSIVVLNPTSKANEINGIDMALKTSFCRYEYLQERIPGSGRDLVLIPASAKHMSHEDLVNLFQAAKKKLESHGLTVFTFSEYTQRFFKNLPEDNLTISNSFGELLNYGTEPQEGRKELSSNEETHDDGNDGFTPVNRRADKRKSYLEANDQKSHTRCRWKKYCSKKLECKFGHTKEEEDYFKTYGNKKATKTRLCTNKECIRGGRCSSAHGEENLFCPNCEKTGHGMWACPDKSGKSAALN